MRRTTIAHRNGRQVETADPEQVKANAKPATEKPNREAKPPKGKQQPEYRLQVQFAKWLQWKYPDVLFSSDTVAQIKLTFPQQGRNKAIQKEGFKWPDIFIAEMRGGYGGLFFELKAETPYLKDGVTLKKNEHVEAQAACMETLRGKGYYCAFAWDIDQLVAIFENYMNL